MPISIFCPGRYKHLQDGLHTENLCPRCCTYWYNTEYNRIVAASRTERHQYIPKKNKSGVVSDKTSFSKKEKCSNKKKRKTKGTRVVSRGDRLHNILEGEGGPFVFYIEGASRRSAEEDVIPIRDWQRIWRSSRSIDDWMVEPEYKHSCHQFQFNFGEPSSEACCLACFFFFFFLKKKRRSISVRALKAQ